MPRPRGAAGLLLAVACLSAWPAPGSALPPVRYNGELRVNGRAIDPDAGNETYLFGRSARLNAESYIWQPWFASIGGTLDWSWIDTFAESDSDTTLLGGEARTTLFPASRFPTFAFANVSDTRSNFESTEIPERQVRVTRFGLAQSYQPRTGGASLAARADRSIEEGTEDRLKAVIDRFDFNGSFLTERQRFSGNFNVKDTSRDLNDENLLELVGTLRHNARPTDTVTVDSFATYTDTSSESTIARFSNRTVQANSLALWRPRRVPLTVSSTARVTAARQSRDGEARENNSGSFAAGADYLINRLTRLSGNVNVNITEERTSSNQGATLSYNPDPFGLGGFTYNWFSSSSVSNELGTATGDRTIFGALFGHGVTRARPFTGAPAWTLSVAGNNTVSGSFDTLDGAAGTLGLNGSLGLSHARSKGLTTLRLNATDSHSFGATRTFATGDNNFQSVNFNLGHRQELSGSSQWNATVSMGWNRQDFGDSTTTTEFSNMNVTYRNTRLFGVRRMLFSSTFDARTVDLFFADIVKEENTDMRWENRIDYFIGKLETRLTGTWSRVNARDNFTVLLTIARKFDGVF